MLDLGRADAEGERPEGAMRRGVAVAADDGHPGLRQPQLRSDDMDDPLVLAPQIVERHAELPAIAPQLLDLLCRDRVGDASRARRGRHAVVHGRRRQEGPPDGQPAPPQPLERLGRGDFVHQVQVDIEDGGTGRLMHDPMRVPDLLEKRSRRGHGRR